MQKISRCGVITFAKAADSGARCLQIASIR